MNVEEYGYDATFVSDTPEYLLCPVCHLVLRDPMLVISCGHKFCTPCFHRMASKAGTSALLCPIDRDVIDATKVCAESGLRRTIGCLIVKCGNHEDGCIWEGHLSDLSGHEQQCQYKKQQQQPDNSEMIRMVHELRSRMDCYEERMENKDKELAHVKMKWKDEVDELKRNEVQTRKQLEDLQGENSKMKIELISLKKNEEDLRRENSEMRKEQEKHCRENAEIKVELNILKKEQENFKTVNQLFEEEIRRLDGVIKQTSLQALANHESSDLGRGASGSELRSKPLMGKLLELYGGSVEDVHIADNNHLKFGEGAITVVGMPSALLSLDDKVYFEVTCTDIQQSGYCGFGWAPRLFKASSEKVQAFKLSLVKWYCPITGQCSDAEKNKWKFGVRRCDLGSEYVIGVAADMEKGQLLYSFNGKWDAPMGIAFNNLSRTTRYFPVFAGTDMTLIVNVGDAEFIYLPPSQSYKKCNTLFL